MTQRRDDVRDVLAHFDFEAEVDKLLPLWEWARQTYGDAATRQAIMRLLQEVIPEVVEAVLAGEPRQRALCRVLLEKASVFRETLRRATH